MSRLLSTLLSSHVRRAGEQRRRRRLLVAVVMMAAVLVPTGQAHALSKIPCKPSVGMSQIDPIVARGSGASAHPHEFFGNNALLNLAEPQSATYDQLVGQTTACANAGDSAAYWAPVLLVDGQPLPAARFIAYYRSFDHKAVGQAQPYPADLRMVTARYSWSCHESSTIVKQQTIPDCGTVTGTTVRLTVHYTFPSCWDGQLSEHATAGNTADHAPSGVANHLAFYVKSRAGNSCPPGYPVMLPELLENVSWGSGSASYWVGKAPALSSDEPGAAPGSSAHADFLQSWVPSALQTMVEQCINVTPTTTANCG